jgi:hypothetical protein
MGYYNRYQGNSEDHSEIFWKPILQQTGKSRRDKQISWHIWPTKIEPREH